MADQITSADWSPKLDATPGDGSGLGQVVQGLEDVEQCISIILSTPKGSDILRPTFGCDLWKYIDRPITQSLPAIVREATEALTLWEPRIDLIRVLASVSSDGSGLTVTAAWKLKSGGAGQTTTHLIAQAGRVPLAV